MEEEELKKSKFNTAVSKEVRRAELWKDANNHSRNKQFEKWNEDLDCIWSELCADLKDKFEAKKEELDKIDKEIFKVGMIIDMKRGFNKITTEQLITRTDQYKKLRDKEIFLRRLENELGKGTAYEDEDDDSF